MNIDAIFCLCFVLVWATPLQKSLLKEVSVKDIDSRILNGAQAALGQFPWEAALYVNIGTTTYFCSGNIISEEWILTVAQCIIGADSIDVLAGLIDLNGSGTVARGTEIVLHGDYDPDAFNNDIGLIKLSTPITFNVNVAPIALAETLLEDGIDVRVSGWGATSDVGGVSEFLSYVDLVTIRNSECIAVYGNTIVDSIVCAQSATALLKSVCKGDGGSPLVIDAGISPVLVGLVSFISTDGCESGHPTGFTRTAAYRDWIRTNSGV
jgi:secreted trypsin-like serine protease